MRDLLTYAVTDTQRKHLEAVIQHGSQRKAAKALGVHKSAVDACISRIKTQAARQGYSPEHGMTQTVPDGYRVNAAIGAANIKLPKVSRKKPKATGKGLMNAYVFGDPHLNMRCWARETGRDWDLDIAIKHHRAAIGDMISRAPNAEHGLLCWLGDAFHSDSVVRYFESISGNILDTDGRLSMALDEAIVLARMMIDAMLDKYQAVTGVFVRGNHSPTLELALSKMIALVYENEPRVSILDNTGKHIPLELGDNFLLMTHGDRLNDQKKADIVVSKYRTQHGRAKFSHVLSGHVHHASKATVSGVLVEKFNALPTPDAWHTAECYVTSDQSSSVLTYHHAGGIVGRSESHPRIFLGDEDSEAVPRVTT